MRRKQPSGKAGRSVAGRVGRGRTNAFNRAADASPRISLYSGGAAGRAFGAILLVAGIVGLLSRTLGRVGGGSSGGSGGITNGDPGSTLSPAPSLFPDIDTDRALSSTASSRRLPEGLASFPSHILATMPQNFAWQSPATEALARMDSSAACAPPGRLLHDDPVVCERDRLLSPEEAARLVAMASAELRGAQVEPLPGRRGTEDAVQATRSAGRNSRVAWLFPDEDPFLRDIVERVASVVGLPASHSEALQVVRYRGAGESYGPHFDTFMPVDPRTGAWFPPRAAGQRIATALVYLSDVPEGSGGRTLFPELQLQVRPQVGKLLLFHTCERGFNLASPDALHAGESLRHETGTTLEKWIVNLWWRERPVEDRRRERVLAGVRS